MSVVNFKSTAVKGKPAGKRAVRGAEGSPKKGEPGYSPNYVETEGYPDYTYMEASVTPIEGDSDGSETFKTAFDELFKGDFKKALRWFVKGYNFHAKKSAAPKSDAKQTKALRTLAEASGLSIAELKEKLGIA